MECVIETWILNTWGIGKAKPPMAFAKPVFLHTFDLELYLRPYKINQGRAYLCTVRELIQCLDNGSELQLTFAGGRQVSALACKFSSVAKVIW